MNKRLLYLAVIVALLLVLPGAYSLGERVVAKRHIQKGCEAFMKDFGAGDSDNVAVFQDEFSKAALSDPIYLPVAQASDALDASREIAARSGFEQQWIEALGIVQGLCWSHFPKEK